MPNVNHFEAIPPITTDTNDQEQPRVDERDAADEQTIPPKIEIRRRAVPTPEDALALFNAQLAAHERSDKNIPEGPDEYIAW